MMFLRYSLFVLCRIPLAPKSTRPFSSTSHIMSAVPRIISEEELCVADSKWITLKKIKFSDQKGTERVWEAAERKTRGETGIDAVAIMAILQPRNKNLPPATLVIEQYRPPVDKFVVEFPAGLIDPGETPESTAKRELKEETGFEADAIIESSSLMVSDPGMSSANMKLIVVRVPVEDYDDCHLPPQVLEPGEFIKPVIVELDKLHDKLEEYSARGNYIIDARLAHLAIGYELRKQLGQSGESIQE